MENLEVLIKSREPETGKVYAFLFSQEDAIKIIENEGSDYFEIINGYVGYKEHLLMIKQGQGCQAFLNTKHVLDQINNQLH